MSEEMTREQAIEELSIMLNKYQDSITGDALDMAIAALSAEPMRWIPIEDELPEDKQEILFSTKTGRVHSGKYHDDSSANPWYSHRDKVRAWSNVVTAWMSLPEPYEAESEERYENRNILYH